MTEEDVRKLLGVVMAYDNRKPSVATLTAWTEQSERGRWTLDEAREAVHIHHSESTEWLMPAHITAILKRERQKPGHIDESRQLEGAPSADPKRIHDLVTEVASRLGWSRRTPTGADTRAIEVECPYCHAAPKRMCARQVTTGPHRGEWATLKNFHASRLDASKEQT